MTTLFLVINDLKKLQDNTKSPGINVGDILVPTTLNTLNIFKNGTNYN